jgi:hypothetical protein
VAWLNLIGSVVALVALLTPPSAHQLAYGSALYVGIASAISLGLAGTFVCTYATARVLDVERS